MRGLRLGLHRRSGSGVGRVSAKVARAFAASLTAAVPLDCVIRFRFEGLEQFTKICQDAPLGRAGRNGSPQRSGGKFPLGLQKPRPEGRGHLLETYPYLTYP